MRVDFTYVKNGRVCHESDVCDSVSNAVEAFEARTAVRSYRVSVDDSDEQYDEEMLAEERGFRATIGGSDAAAVLGLSPFKTNVEVWEEKVGLRVPEDISAKPQVKYGTEAESPLFQLFALDHPQFRCKEGVIFDICQSTVSGTYYKVQLDGKPRPSTVAFTDEMLSAVSKATYEYEFSYLDKVVVAMLYEVKNGQRTLVARGHGHIIHDGLEGITQAASYALRRIDLKVRGVDAT